MHRPPEDEIATLTADAYALFPDVRRSDTPACAHCISRARQRRLMMGRREAIPHEDVAFYAFKAMTTWGEATRRSTARCGHASSNARSRSTVQGSWVSQSE